MVILSCSFIVMIFSRHISWERNKRHLLTYCCHGYWDLQSPYCQLCFSAFGLFSLPLILKWFRCKLRLLYLLNSNARCWVKVEFTVNGECFSNSMSCLAFESDPTKKLLFSLVDINSELFYVKASYKLVLYSCSFTVWQRCVCVETDVED